MLYKSKLDSSKLTMTAFSFLLYTPLQECFCSYVYVLNLSFLLFALIYFRREDRFCYFPVILIGIHLAQVLFLF